MPSVRSLGYAGRRLRQTFTHFRNGPQILWSIARSRDITFHTRTGLRVHVPNVQGARFPVYEITADDVYRLDELLAGLRPDFVGIDIGAHIGSLSTAVLQRSPDATMHAFEASPSTAQWLQRNARENDMADRLVVHPQAVSDHEGVLEFVDNGSASAHNGLTAPDGLGTIVAVPCITFAQAHARAGGHVDLVKCDAEGAEYGFILGSDPDLWLRVERVVMEYHPVDGRSLDDLATFLAAAGLELVRDEPAHDKPGLGNAWFARPA